jgi:hypothetical protein
LDQKAADIAVQKGVAERLEDSPESSATELHQPLRHERTLLAGNPFAPLAEGADEAGAAAEPAAAHPPTEPPGLEAEAEAAEEQGTCASCDLKRLQGHKAELTGTMASEEEQLGQTQGRQHRGRRHALRQQLAQKREFVQWLEGELRALEGRIGPCICGADVPA